MVDLSQLSQEDIDAWYASQKRGNKMEDKSIPTETEEVEAGNAFKVSKTQRKEPRIMTPDQVRKEAPVKNRVVMQEVVPEVAAAVNVPTVSVSSSQYEEEEGQGSRWPEHQSISLKREPHESTWQEGLYDVTIERTWQDIAPDQFHKDPSTGDPLTAVFLHVGFITEDGQRIQKRMSMCPSGHEKCFKTKMLISLFGDPAPDDINTDDLVGMKLQVFIENIKNRKGDIWPTVTKTVKSTKQFQTAGAS